MSEITAAPAPVRAKSSFLSHVNGMRALAILAIFFYHMSAPLCPAGYYGVDIFLLITGYFLFARELTPERLEGFSYGSYLWRKVWRIAPPVVVVGVAVALFALFFLPVSRGECVFYTLMSAVCGVSNEYVARSGGYFSPATQENPLMHFWYIGLTFQLYLLVPLMVRLFRSGRRTWLYGLSFGLCALLSLLIYLAMSYRDMSPGLLAATSPLYGIVYPYYCILARLWEPLAALLVLLLPVCAGGRVLRSLLALAGLGLAVVPMFVCESGSAMVLPTLLGAILLLRYGDSGPVGWLLSLKPVQWVGTFSFSLYLVHWPVFTLWKYVCFGDVGVWDYIGMSGLSIILSFILWRWVETRCGGWLKSLSRRRAGWTMGLALGLPLLCSALVAFVPPVKALFPPGNVEDKLQLRHPVRSWFVPGRDLGDFPSHVFSSTPIPHGDNEAAPVTWLLMGDSHSWHLSYGFDAIACRKGLRGMYFNNSCMPACNCYIETLGGDAQWSREMCDSLIKWLRELPTVRTVIISCYWNLRLDDNDVRDWDRNKLPSEQMRPAMEQGIREFCRRLKDAGKQVILVGDTPFWPRKVDHVDLFMRHHLLGIDYPLPTRTPENLAVDMADEDSFFRSLEAEGLITYVDPAPLFLREDGAYHFRTSDGAFLLIDTNHLSGKGGTIVAEHIINQYLTPGKSAK